MSLTNADLVELLRRAGDDESDHRRRALHRASRAAMFWPEEAGDVAASGRSLTELRSVGPWVGAKIHGWLDEPPVVPEPDETRRDFLTLAEVRRALDPDPSWEGTPHADLQVHSTASDGKLAIEEVARLARDLGRPFIASTDHSKSLTIANGMSEERLAAHVARIDALNETFEGAGDPFRVLRSIEMDVFPDGSPDMPPEALAPLDLVLGAFHSKLRLREDQTDRYLAALREPSVHVLAHPQARMYGRRTGLSADWSRVFAEAARVGKAVELDATPARQDLSVRLARVAVDEGVGWFSVGSDAHVAVELEFLPFGLATAVLAGVPRERILNYRTVEEVRAWAEELRSGPI
ncbi:MAG TPA: PHP domain-containing protein [Actinomycetota bacterium]|nr:PHP domain-containing protein [Actinomycetota bacterium]